MIAHYSSYHTTTNLSFSFFNMFFRLALPYYHHQSTKYQTDTCPPQQRGYFTKHNNSNQSLKQLKSQRAKKKLGARSYRKEVVCGGIYNGRVNGGHGMVQGLHVEGQVGRVCHYHQSQEGGLQNV